MTSAEIHRAMKNRILDAITRMPDVFAWNNPTGVYCPVGRPESRIRVGNPGAADILGAAGKRGTTFGIEVKTGGGTQDPDQIKWQAKLESVGGYYFVCHDVREALEAITAIKLRTK